jgi:hypothetical protein|tara:strand:- start:279 stop:422 length:144 start_codon:yes stop_codon:yes gene_type:complete
MDNEIITKTATSLELERIANALEEILRLVKKDMEDNKKRWEKETIGE